MVLAPGTVSSYYSPRPGRWPRLNDSSASVRQLSLAQQRL